jgi:lipoprotein-releasing system ATP-binding protein
MSNSAPNLIVTKLCKSYPTAGGELPVLCDVDLQMSRGDALAITGPSGSGKSTLLYILGTLDRPTSGSVRILEQDQCSLGAADVARFRNSTVGFIFQDHHLLPQCSVLENVLIPTLAADGTPGDVESRAQALLERVGLGQRTGHRPAALSGGERQRVAVCRALINQPSLLLADEPTGNLDRASAQEVGSLLLDLARDQGCMLITVTHSAELASRFPRHMELRDGRLADVSDIARGAR